jgi:hypothetical protein
MSTSVFKGGIRVGEIKARFMSDFSNADSDLLVMSTAELGGGANAQVARAIAAPGGFAEVKLNIANPSVLEVFVVTGHATDSGRLEVSRAGVVKDNDAILGPVRWVYSVEPV